MKQLVKLSIIYVNEYVFYIYIHFRFIFDTRTMSQILIPYNTQIYPAYPVKKTPFHTNRIDVTR